MGRSDAAASAPRLAFAGGTMLLVGLLCLSAAVQTGCTRYKKLSGGGSAAESLFYDVFGQDRSAEYYYNLVKESHDERDFCYRCGGDTYLVDKNIDAIYRLGRAEFARLEGQAVVLELLTEVVLEDRSSLARAAAATTITRIGVRLPRYGYRPIPDPDAAQRNAHTAELQRIYGGANGTRPRDEATRRRVIALMTRLGELEYPDLLKTKNALRLFYGSPFLIDEADPALRQAIDTALVKRSMSLVHVALDAAVEDPDETVRSDAIRGLKTLNDAKALETIAYRLEMEPEWTVRLEAVEYMGKMGTKEAVAVLVPLLDDPNASVRHKARGALTRVAGTDMGFRRKTWAYWARQRYPGIDLGGEKADPEDDSTASGPP